MKYKKIGGAFVICAIICIIAGVGYSSRNKQDKETAKVKEVFVSYESKVNHFFYNQLSEQEKEVYKHITEKLDNYQGGEIKLKEPISPKSLVRISDTIRYDGERKYWYFLVAFPFNENNESILTGLSQPEESLNKDTITKLLIGIDMGDSQDKLQSFMLDWDESYKLRNYEKFKELLEETKIDTTYYKEVAGKIQDIEKEIIDSMPKDITQEEAVQYFGNWILENMQYDMNMLEVNGSSDWSFGELTKLMHSSSLACVVEKKGLCSGLAVFMADLCNEVGIEANLSLGTVGFNKEKTDHAWVQVNIAGEIFYKDPTYENSYKNTKSLQNRKQLLDNRMGYSFTEHFNWE